MISVIVPRGGDEFIKAHGGVSGNPWIDRGTANARSRLRNAQVYPCLWRMTMGAMRDVNCPGIAGASARCTSGTQWRPPDMSAHRSMQVAPSGQGSSTIGI
jgi:hypothetical protein